MKFLTKTILILIFFLAFHAGIASAATIGLPLHNAGLVGYWPMDEGGGLKAQDRSGQYNNGTLTSMDASTDWVSGKYGGALDFDGVNDYVDVTSIGISGIASRTITGWVKIRAYGNDDGIWSMGIAGTAKDFSLELTATPGVITFNGWNRDFDFTIPSNVYGWHHIAITYDGSYVRAYVDGVELNSGNFTDLNTTDSGIEFGRSRGSSYSNTVIDEVRIYNRTLSADEVTRLYKLGRPRLGVSPKNLLTNGLLGHWTFDGLDMNATRALDSTPNAYHGTLTGGPVSSLGKVGQALSFDGTNTVSIPAGIQLALSGGTEVTLAGWFKGSQIQSMIRLQNGGYIILTWNGAEKSLVSTDGITTGLDFGGQNLEDGEWHHVAMTWKKNTTNGWVNYVDGNIANQKDSADVNLPLLGAASYLGSHNGSSEFMTGQLDDIRIYNRALSSAEIKKIYDVTKGSVYNKTNKDRLTNGLVGHWTFDGPDMNATQALDSTANANHGTLSGPTRAIGKVGQALSFDGVDDYINAGSDSSLDNLTTITISAWIYPTGWGEATWGRILVKGNAAGGFFFLSNDATEGVETLNFFQNFSTTDGYWRTPTSSMVLNKWQHVAVTYDRSSTSNDPILYIDGVSKSVTEISGYTPAGSDLDDSAEDLYIGNTPDNSRTFAGKIDEVRVYNRILTPEEISIIYNIGR